MKVLDLKEIDYRKALAYQEQLVEEVFEDPQKSFLLLCTHPRVLTKGRGSSSKDIVGWRGDVVETSRGGRVTYHGPEQLVVYPIFKLKEKKLLEYLRGLEDLAMTTFSDLGLEGVSRRPSLFKENKEAKDLKFTGVWCGDKKLVSIGVAVRKGVVFHGMAVHVFKTQDLGGFKPCGFSLQTLSSLEEQMGPERRPSQEELKKILSETFLKKLLPEVMA